MPFFFTVIFSSGISSESPNDNKPVFLSRQSMPQLIALFGSRPLFSRIHVLFRLQPSLRLSPSLCCGDTRYDVIERVLHDSDASDLGRASASARRTTFDLLFRPLLGIEFELTDVQYIWTSGNVDTQGLAVNGVALYPTKQGMFSRQLVRPVQREEEL
jgi:hypothetical protein